MAQAAIPHLLITSYTSQVSQPLRRQKAEGGKRRKGETGETETSTVSNRSLYFLLLHSWVPARAYVRTCNKNIKQKPASYDNSSKPL